MHPCGAARVHPADEKLTLTVDERYGDLDEAAGAADAIACSGAAVCVG